MGENEQGQRILTLAAEIAEATDREVPHLLLEIRGNITNQLYYLYLSISSVTVSLVVSLAFYQYYPISVSFIQPICTMAYNALCSVWSLSW